MDGCVHGDGDGGEFVRLVDAVLADDVAVYVLVQGVDAVIACGDNCNSLGASTAVS